VGTIRSSPARIDLSIGYTLVNIEIDFMICKSIRQWRDLVFGAPGEPPMSKLEPDEYAYSHEYYEWFWENLGK
jgi:hypothetical protein